MEHQGAGPEELRAEADEYEGQAAAFNVKADELKESAPALSQAHRWAAFALHGLAEEYIRAAERAEELSELTR